MNWKSILIPAIILIILGGAVYWLTTKSRDSTFSAKNTEFAVKDTAAIDEIHLSNMKGKQVKLKEKTEKHEWMVNGQYPASQSKIQNLLHTIKKVEVKKPVPLEARENVVKGLASNNVQVDIYKEGNLVRSYFVGHQTPSELGTYMAMNNSDKEPYVTHIPGFYGYLTTRYFADPGEWRSTQIWNFNPVSIQEVTMEYPERDDWSFKLQKAQAERFKLTRSSGQSGLPNPSEKAIKRYLTQFRDFHCIEDLNDQQKRDSLQQLKPDARIQVKTTNDRQRSIKLFGVFRKKPDTLTSGARAKNLQALTPERPHQILLVQDRIVEPMLARFQDFESSEIN